jgi:hypothetical protein
MIYRYKFRFPTGKQFAPNQGILLLSGQISPRSAGVFLYESRETPKDRFSRSFIMTGKIFSNLCLVFAQKIGYTLPGELRKEDFAAAELFFRQYRKGYILWKKK